MEQIITKIGKDFTGDVSFKINSLFLRGDIEKNLFKRVFAMQLPLIYKSLGGKEALTLDFQFLSLKVSERIYYFEYMNSCKNNIRFIIRNENDIFLEKLIETCNKYLNDLIYETYKLNE